MRQMRESLKSKLYLHFDKFTSSLVTRFFGYHYHEEKLRVQYYQWAFHWLEAKKHRNKIHKKADNLKTCSHCLKRRYSIIVSCSCDEHN
jgi:hypothetical protein